jgi:hypothetical protein
MVLKTEFVPFDPLTKFGAIAAPPAPTVIVYVVFGVTANPDPVLKPPAPPPPP